MGSSRTIVPILAVLTLAACTASGTGASDASRSVPASRDAGASGVETTSSAASPSADATPSAETTEEPQVAVDAWVVTTADDLSMRAAPGESGELIGVLMLGAEATVIAGPEAIEGVDWFELARPGRPPESGIEDDCVSTVEDSSDCPRSGWVAAESRDGSPWLEARRPPCPSATPRSVGDLVDMTPGLRLACFADQELTLTGYLSPESAGRGCVPSYVEEPAWLNGCMKLAFLQATETEVEAQGPEIAVHVHPDLGDCEFGGTGADCPFPPLRGRWVQVAAHYADPASETCTGHSPHAGAVVPDPAELRYECREALVVTAIEPGFPPGTAP